MMLDHIDKLELSGDAADKYGNELRPLSYLSEGLYYLYKQVKGIEVTVAPKPNPKMRVSIFGNEPQKGLVVCAFHWYAVTICNYVRLIGWLTHGEDKHQATEYVKRVIPAVYLWRNKVAAHFSITDPQKEDTPADLAKSVMSLISFDDDAYFADSLTLSMRRKGTTSTSRQDMRWSLTHTHENLSTRYWPDSGQ